MKRVLYRHTSSLQIFVLCFTFLSCLSVVPVRLEEPRHTAKDVVYDYSGFSLLYDSVHKQARWVAYELTAEEASTHTAQRTDHFYSDPRIAASATTIDYLHSGYDRGHLAPAGDMSYSEESMIASFSYSNISPQNPSFNRGIWANIEALVRIWATELGSVYVVTGPVLRPTSSDQVIVEPARTIGENQVTVPDYFYKAILFVSETETKAIAFILPNSESKMPPEIFTVSIDTAEIETGLDFFPSLPDVIETRVEASFNFLSWPLEVRQ